MGKCPTIFTMGRAAEAHAPVMFAGALFVYGMLHPQYILDYEMHIAKILARLDDIRSGAYKPGRTAWVDPSLIFQAHDAAANLLLTALLGTTVIYTGAMDIYNNTGDARRGRGVHRARVRHRGGGARSVAGRGLLPRGVPAAAGPLRRSVRGAHLHVTERGRLLARARRAHGPVRARDRTAAVADAPGRGHGRGHGDRGARRPVPGPGGAY